MIFLIYTISFNFHNFTVRIIILFPFFRWGHWIPEEKSDFSPSSQDQKYKTWALAFRKGSLLRMTGIEKWYVGDENSTSGISLTRRGGLEHDGSRGGISNFCKGLWGPYGLWCNYSALPHSTKAAIKICNQMGVDVLY